MNAQPEIEAAVARLVRAAGFSAGFALRRLAGDASAREFHRVEFTGASRPRSLVVMHYLEYDPAAAHAFHGVRDTLERAGVRVPRCHAHDGPLALLEDFGDLTLEHAVAGSLDDDRSLALYRDAIDTLIDIQFGPMSGPRGGCPAFDLAFDEEKLMWELDFFIKNAIEIFTAKSLSPRDDEFIRGRLGEIVSRLASQPRLFTHRDYHSRNLMVTDAGLGVIDFQDARLGLLQYDLVSLLEDSYVGLPRDVVNELKKYYIHKAATRRGEPFDEDEFENIYRLMTIQRSLKAAGSFAFLDCVKKKDRYLVNLPGALGRAYSAMDQAGCGDLREALENYLPARGTE